jgi:hypothetical protein
MGKLKEMSLDLVQLNCLFNREEKDAYDFLLKNGVFCTRCNTICTEGVNVASVSLNWMNDIVVEGNCNVCGQSVTRIIEFGENQEFFIKAMEFRSSIIN